MSTDDDLGAELRALFSDADLDVEFAPTLPGQVLQRTLRARRRATQMRAVTAVAAVAAAGGAAVTMNHNATGGDATVRPAAPLRSDDPRCQEYWSPPTPGPDTSYTGGPFGIPTLTGGPEQPINPETDPFSTSAPEWEGRTPYPMRGPHGGVLCTVVEGKASVLTQEGFDWPKDEPMPSYEMFPGETPGQWNSPAPADTRPPSKEDIERHERASATIWTYGPSAPESTPSASSRPSRPAASHSTAPTTAPAAP